MELHSTTTPRRTPLGAVGACPARPVAIAATWCCWFAITALSPTTEAASPPPPGAECAVDTTLTALEPVGFDSTGTFGWATAVDGDWIAVGAPGSDATVAGRVELFHRVGGVWTHHSIITPLESALDDRFGTDLAMRGDTLLIGAPRADGATLSCGVAYVFRRIGDRWMQEATLGSNQSQSDDQFGIDVALDGDWAVVGAPKHDQLGADSGAAYLFVRVEGSRGEAWSPDATLLALDGQSGDRFGTTVKIDQGVVAVGAPFDEAGSGASNTGSVRIFELGRSGWIETSKLDAVAASAQFGATAFFFGSQLEFRAGTLVAGSSAGTQGAGSVFVYDRVDGGWGPPRLAVSPGVFSGFVPTRALALSPDGEVAAWTAGQVDPTGAGEPTLNVIWRDGGDWSTEHSLSPSAGSGINSPRSSAALDGATVVLGVPKTTAETGGAGRAFVAALPPRDRDHDGLADACEIAAGLAEDCDKDGVIDDAQRPFRFTADSAPADEYWQAGANNGAMILNRFATTLDGQVLHSVSWLRPPVPASPIASATVVVYGDPNEDGNPVDGVLLSAQPVELLGVASGEWVTIPVAPVPLGPAGTSFFVGMVFTIAGTPIVASEAELPHRQASWWVAAIGPTLDLANLGGEFVSPWEVVSGEPGTVLLRANLEDCDESG